ncbi:MAG: AAA family ATPase, partial [Bacilli bacterium]|nr:AAA family ATPase [Bacilli bacterium]
TKKIEYVNLNPHNNLMRFQHTSIREEEGWNPENGIWSVYKPENQSISGGVKDIKVPAWEEIDKLVNGIILDNGLKDIHSEVLKNIKDIDKKEVDFNFVITRFYCKNWRSIEEVELFFGDMDKVLITGSNGSGKSSLLSAIKYAFQENSSLKDFVQFGTKECITEVEFLYQGNGYKIQRGSKKYGFWINGEPQKYNNVTEFRKDMHVRFPFIDYMDIYFFDSDHPKLIGDITPERKSEIISKFYKMDKIDAYNDTATELYNKYVESCRGWKAEIDKTRELLGYIRTKLDNIQLPGVSEKELREKRELGSILQKKWMNYNQFMTMTANLQAQKRKYRISNKFSHGGTETTENCSQYRSGNR